jgi:hypothetical protein
MHSCCGRFDRSPKIITFRSSGRSAGGTLEDEWQLSVRGRRIQPFYDLDSRQNPRPMV